MVSTLQLEKRKLGKEFKPFRKYNPKFVVTALGFQMMIISNAFTTLIASAEEDKVLTNLFDSSAFKGSWSVLEKFNGLGWFLNFLISAVCFIALFGLAFQTIVTIGFFAMPNFWKNVDEVKKENMNSAAFGMKGYLDGAWNAKRSSGLGSLLNIFYAFVPNFYEMSEMGSQRESNLSEDDSVVTWFIKTFPKKILLGLLLSMGFNGSLMQCYGTVIDAGAVVAQSVADYQLDNVVEKFLSSGDNFSFSLGDDGTGKGETLEDIARAIYKQVISKCEILDAAQKQQVGAAIQNRVTSEVTQGNMLSAISHNNPTITDLTDDDWGYIKLQITCNSDSQSSAGQFVFALEDFTSGTWDTHYYVHVTPTLQKRAPSKDYINS